MRLKASTKKAAINGKEATLQDKCRKMRTLIEEVEFDMPKFEDKSNKSAGIRIRKAMQEMKLLAQDIRMQILTASK